MDWKEHNLNIGRLGENIAKEYLKKKGYVTIDQNYKNKYAEIDLIVQDKNSLVFVEVKTRIGEQFGIPEDSLNKDKMHRFVRNARAYMAYNAKNYKSCRIDAVCIVLDENREIKRIKHYENLSCP